MSKPSFFKKAQAENVKKREVMKKALKGNRFPYMGDPALHWSCGGYLRGGLNLFYGPSKSGKSTLSLMYAGQEQKDKGGVVVLLDTENSYIDPEEVDDNGEYTEGALRSRVRFENAGIDLDNLLLWKSNQQADIFEPLRDMEKDLEKDPTCVAAIIVDSWEGVENVQAAAKISKGKAEDAGNSFGGNAKAINPILKRLVHLNTSYAVTVFSVQHVRVSMEQYGPKWLIPGGQTFIHLHNMIMMIEGVETKKNALMEGDEQGTATSDMAQKVGKMIRFKCDKSRAVVEGRAGETFINFTDVHFAKPEESLFNLAVRLGVVIHPINEKTGNPNNLWWQYPANSANPAKFNGAKGIIDALTEDKDLYSAVWESCKNSSNKSATDTHDMAEVVCKDDDGKVHAV